MSFPDKATGVLVSTLSKKTGFCKKFLKSLRQHHPHFPDSNIMVVDDGLDMKEMMQDFGDICFIPGFKPFAFSRNANMAMYTARTYGLDLFLCNDDTAFTETNSIYTIKSLADHYGSGILSPVFTRGVGNPNQLKGTLPNDRMVYDDSGILCFVAVYIPHATLAKVGYMNEVFDENCYGYEDNEYCDRVRRAGMKLQITPKVVMHHGGNMKEASCTYSDNPNIRKMVLTAKERYDKLPK